MKETTHQTPTCFLCGASYPKALVQDCTPQLVSDEPTEIDLTFNLAEVA